MNAAAVDCIATIIGKATVVTETTVSAKATVVATASVPNNKRVIVIVTTCTFTRIRGCSN